MVQQFLTVASVVKKLRAGSAAMLLLGLFPDVSAAQMAATPTARQAMTTEALAAQREADLRRLLTSRATAEQNLAFQPYSDLLTAGPETTATAQRPPARRRGRQSREEGGVFFSTLDQTSRPVTRQPAGPLSGRIIYTSAGHGWTNHNTSTTVWYTQRPALLGMVEDFGNQDQLTVFADAAFRSGATVVPMRPVGNQPVERVLDNLNTLHVKFQGEWAPGSRDAGFRLGGGPGPGYLVARASSEETAVARFQPVIPEQDWYPVYVQAPAGPDRIIQTYRVVIGDAVTEVDIDHRKVGDGWIYIGEYLLPAGSVSYVEVTNRARDPRQVQGGALVVADAVRFGNGRGDTNRGGGISGRLREDEAALYWVARSLPEADQAVAYWSAADGDSSVGAPARMAAYMNQERAVRDGDAVYIGWHSNARPTTAKEQRGALTLLTRDETSRTKHQEPLAAALIDSFNALMSAAEDLPAEWTVHPQRIVSFINYGEIRVDSLNNEIPATIVESAFHDSPADVALLLDLRSRRLMADATVSGTVAFLRALSGEAPLGAEEILPPGRPRLLLAAGDSTTTGAIHVAVEPSTEGGRATGMVLETGGLSGTLHQFAQLPSTSATLTLPTTATQQLRVFAEGPGGRSLPSNILAVSPGGDDRSRVLLVSAFESEDASNGLIAFDDGPFNTPTGPSGSYSRAFPRLINLHEQAAEVARDLNALGLACDAMTEREFSKRTIAELRSYRGVIFLEGRETTGGDQLTTSTVDLLLEASVNLPVLLSGAAIVRPRMEQDPLRARLATAAGIRHGGTTSETARLIWPGEMPITSGALTATRRIPSGFEPMVLDRLEVPEPPAGTTVVLRHLDSSRQPAATFRASGGGGGLFVIGAPVENLAPTLQRRSLIGKYAALVGANGGLAAPALDE